MHEVPTTPTLTEAMLPAVAQGAIGMERRTANTRTADFLCAIHNVPTAQRLAAERAFLAALDGSCATSITDLATVDSSSLHFNGKNLGQIARNHCPIRQLHPSMTLWRWDTSWRSAFYHKQNRISSHGKLAMRVL